VSKQTSTAVTKAPANVPAPAESVRPGLAGVVANGLLRHPWVLWAAGALLVAVAAVSVLYSSVPAGQGDGLLLCRRFARLKQAHDPGAGDLLGPARSAPPEPITPEEAERIDADTFLRRDDLQILSVRPATSAGDAGRFILVTKGSATGELLHVRSGDKVDDFRRVTYSPDIVVEVRDGKIVGVRPQLNTD